jgi:hypothetical protein
MTTTLYKETTKTHILLNLLLVVIQDGDAIIPFLFTMDALTCDYPKCIEMHTRSAKPFGAATRLHLQGHDPDTDIVCRATRLLERHACFATIAPAPRYSRCIEICYVSYTVRVATLLLVS